MRRAGIRERARAMLPEPVIRGLKRIRELKPGGQLTIAEGWDKYARKFGSGQLGEEWNRPDMEGVDVSPEEFVPYLDDTVFGPFLGHVGTLLEIGPGGGRFTDVLLPRCDRLIAADTSSAMLGRIRERFRHLDKIEFVHLDGKGLRQIGDSSVDAVFCYGVFVHLQHWDIYNYLAETCRVLRPGGLALIQHSNTFTDEGWAYFLREVPLQLNRHKLFGTYTVMTPELMAEFATRAGLEVVECRTDVVRTEAISMFRRPDGSS